MQNGGGRVGRSRNKANACPRGKSGVKNKCSSFVPRLSPPPQVAQYPGLAQSRL